MAIFLPSANRRDSNSSPCFGASERWRTTASPHDARIKKNRAAAIANAKMVPPQNVARIVVSFPASRRRSPTAFMRAPETSGATIKLRPGSRLGGRSRCGKMNALMTLTNRTDDSPAQYCEDWIRLACATERMREAFPAKCEYELTEHLDDEFEEQLKKNLEQGSSLRDGLSRRTQRASRVPCASRSRCRPMIRRAAAHRARREDWYRRWHQRA